MPITWALAGTCYQCLHIQAPYSTQETQPSNMATWKPAEYCFPGLKHCHVYQIKTFFKNLYKIKNTNATQQKWMKSLYDKVSSILATKHFIRRYFKSLAFPPSGTGETVFENSRSPSWQKFYMLEKAIWFLMIQFNFIGVILFKSSHSKLSLINNMQINITKIFSNLEICA